MSKKDYIAGRMDGLKLALRAVEQGGIEGLQKEIKYRGNGGVNTNFEPKNDNSNYEFKMDFLKTAISAMQELQMYKENQLCLIPESVYKRQCEELDEYKKLGTLEEVRYAVEKQTAISREIIEGKYFCPKCHNLMPYPGYCGCGQKLY